MGIFESLGNYCNIAGALLGPFDLPPRLPPRKRGRRKDVNRQRDYFALRRLINDMWGLLMFREPSVSLRSPHRLHFNRPHTEAQAVEWCDLVTAFGAWNRFRTTDDASKSYFKRLKKEVIASLPFEKRAFAHELFENPNFRQVGRKLHWQRRGPILHFCQYRKRWDVFYRNYVVLPTQEKLDA